MWTGNPSPGPWYRARCRHRLRPRPGVTTVVRNLRTEVGRVRPPACTQSRHRASRSGGTPRPRDAAGRRSVVQQVLRPGAEEVHERPELRPHLQVIEHELDGGVATFDID